MQLFRMQQGIIGLDVGTSMIKAVKITMKKKKYFLESFALERIEEGAIQSGEIKSPSSLAQSTINAVSKCDKNLKDVVIALPNYSILSDVFAMELVAKKDIREAVLVEAERLSPFDMSEVEIDYEVLERNEETKQMKVLMVAAKNDIIYSYIDCMKEAGLRVIVIDVDLSSYFDTIRHDILLRKVAKRVNDADILRLLKLMLKAGGKRGVPQGSVVSN